MRKRVLLSVLAASIAAVALVSASGAATASAQKVARIDVSTRSAVIRYLRSIHVNPKGVVIQRGHRNYAGTRCPGSGWACTRATHPVVQVAQAGGRNTYRCTTAKCAVVQVAPHALTTNTAKCIKTNGLTQSCVISQTSSSASNKAIVYENTTSSSGLTQTASATASITQKATGAGDNTACVYQNIELNNSTVAKKGSPVTVTSEAHQTVTIRQDSASGANAAAQAATSGGCTGTSLAQTQTLKSVANGSGAITQNQNAASKGPNVSIDIEQNQSSGFNGSATGANTAVFSQTSNLQAIANTPKGPVSQTQSSPDSDPPFSGLVGTINQDSRGISTADATQQETQCEDAATAGLSTCHTAPGDDDFDGTYALHQTQYGPVGTIKAPNAGHGRVHYVHKGDGPSTQTGNDHDTFTIDQSSQQDNDQGEGSQQTNVVQGDCSTSGNCTVTQTTNVDGQQHTNTQSGSDVSAQITCAGDECSSGGGSTTGTLTLLPNGLSVTNTDVTGFGQGGMRGSGTTSIVVSGVSGPVLHAFLFWHGPTNSEDPDSNATVTVNGDSVTGTNIGTASDNNWGFQNSQAYRADVTGLVSETGNGTYNFSNFVKSDADINGVALVVFYDDGNPSDDRNVVLWNGNDSNQPSSFDSDFAWDETISGVPYPGSGDANLDLIVADGQSLNDGELDVNGTPVAGPGAVFQGESGPNYSGNQEGITGSLWDLETFDITSLLSSGSNDLHITSPVASDALSLVVAIADVPVSAPIG